MGLLALRPLGAAEPGPHPLLAYGTEAQKARYVPRLARREILGAFALTEPEAGSDAASLKTRAHREGDFYVLEGQKTFISHANVAEVFLVFAKTDPEKGAKGITCFLVERGDGVKTSPLKGKLGLRAADTGMVFLDGVRVPKDRVLGKEGRGLGSPSPPWTRGASPWRRGRWGSCSALWTSPWPTPGRGSSLASPSPSSSSCRSTWPP